MQHDYADAVPSLFLERLNDLLCNPLSRSRVFSYLRWQEYLIMTLICSPTDPSTHPPKAPHRKDF